MVTPNNLTPLHSSNIPTPSAPVHSRSTHEDRSSAIASTRMQLQFLDVNELPPIEATIRLTRQNATYGTRSSDDESRPTN